MHAQARRYTVIAQILYSVCAWIVGNCTCNPGYTGADCSFNLTSTPQFVEMYNDVCDVTKSDCSQAQVTGAGFVPNVTRCWVKPVKVRSLGLLIDVTVKSSKISEISQCGSETDLIFVDALFCRQASFKFPFSCSRII